MKSLDRILHGIVQMITGSSIFAMDCGSYYRYISKKSLFTNKGKYKHKNFEQFDLQYVRSGFKRFIDSSIQLRFLSDKWKWGIQLIAKFNMFFMKWNHGQSR